MGKIMKEIDAELNKLKGKKVPPTLHYNAYV